MFIINANFTIHQNGILYRQLTFEKDFFSALVFRLKRQNLSSRSRTDPNTLFESST